VLDARAVVPAAVEQHDLSARRQMRRVALEVPLRSLALVGGGDRDDATTARVQEGNQALDHAILARRVASLEQHDQPLALGHDPLLHVHELGLHAQKLLLVLLAAQLDGSGHRGIVAAVRLRCLRSSAARRPRDPSVRLSPRATLNLREAP
jgi:hypothetical protein